MQRVLLFGERPLRDRNADLVGLPVVILVFGERLVGGNLLFRSVLGIRFLPLGLLLLGERVVNGIPLYFLKRVVSEPIEPERITLSLKKFFTYRNVACVLFSKTKTRKKGKPNMVTTRLRQTDPEEAQPATEPIPNRIRCTRHTYRDNYDAIGAVGHVAKKMINTAFAQHVTTSEKCAQYHDQKKTCGVILDGLTQGTGRFLDAHDIPWNKIIIVNNNQQLVECMNTCRAHEAKGQWVFNTYGDYIQDGTPKPVSFIFLDATSMYDKVANDVEATFHNCARLMTRNITFGVTFTVSMRHIRRKKNDVERDIVPRVLHARTHFLQTAERYGMNFICRRIYTYYSATSSTQMGFAIFVRCDTMEDWSVFRGCGDDTTNVLNNSSSPPMSMSIEGSPICDTLITPQVDGRNGEFYSFLLSEFKNRTGVADEQVLRVPKVQELPKLEPEFVTSSSHLEPLQNTAIESTIQASVVKSQLDEPQNLLSTPEPLHPADPTAESSLVVPFIPVTALLKDRKRKRHVGEKSQYATDNKPQSETRNAKHSRKWREEKEGMCRLFKSCTNPVAPGSASCEEHALYSCALNAFYRFSRKTDNQPLLARMRASNPTQNGYPIASLMTHLRKNPVMISRSILEILYTCIAAKESVNRSGGWSAVDDWLKIHSPPNDKPITSWTIFYE